MYKFSTFTCNNFIIINSTLISAETPQPRFTNMYTKGAIKFIGTGRHAGVGIDQPWYRSLPGRDSYGSPILPQTSIGICYQRIIGKSPTRVQGCLEYTSQ